MKIQAVQEIGINKELVKSIANELGEEMAGKIYSKLAMLRYLPEIKAIETKRLKVLKGKKIKEFLKKLAQAK